LFVQRSLKSKSQLLNSRKFSSFGTKQWGGYQICADKSVRQTDCVRVQQRVVQRSKNIQIIVGQPY